jgi:hypothetical protein
MPRLPALVAVGADQPGPAIQAGVEPLAFRFARGRLDGARGEPARHRFADALEAP